MWRHFPPTMLMNTILGRAKGEIEGDVNPLEVLQLRRMSKTMKTGDSIIRKDIKKDEYTCKDLTAY